MTHRPAPLPASPPASPDRRRFLAGAAAVTCAAGAAAWGSLLVSARAAFGAPGQGALVVMFLRGGLDGLSVLVPADDPHLLAARPGIAVPAGALRPLARGFGLHPALAPLHDLWGRGLFTAVPAVSTPDISRSHFQAQDCLERGGAATGTHEGWLDRVLDAVDPGTTFRALTVGTTAARSLAGDQGALSLSDIAHFQLHAGPHDSALRTGQALATLYSGFDHPLVADVSATLAGLSTAAGMVAAPYTPAAAYPDTDAGHQLAEVARLIKADVGLRIACMDVGGWDMHTGIGAVDAGRMTDALRHLGDSLGAFAADLGAGIEQVNVVVLTEFGRRVAQNSNGGTDHGHGAAVLVVGGGVAGGSIPGAWHGLAPEGLDHGDVPGWNDYRDVLAEVITARLGVSAGAMGTIFPEHRVQRLGVMR
jgi:uncharacterized protein (DUF1501 family)